MLRWDAPETGRRKSQVRRCTQVCIQVLERLGQVPRALEATDVDKIFRKHREGMELLTDNTPHRFKSKQETVSVRF